MPYTSWERESLTTPTSVFAEADIASLANNAAALSGEIDNSSGAWTHADFELAVDFGTNPTGPVELYAILAMDGTNYWTTANYVDYQLTATAFAPPGSRLGAFSPRATTSVHRCFLRDVPIPASKFKVMIVNKGGYAFDTTATYTKHLKMWRKRMKLNP